MFVLVLAATGIVLNHTERLGLAARYIDSTAVLDWYGVQPPGKPVSYAAGEHWIGQIGERMYVDARALPGRHGPLLGAVAYAGEVIIAAPGRLLVVDAASGAIVESLGAEHGVPDSLQRIGWIGNGLVIKAARADYVAGPGLSGWSERAPAGAQWARPAPAPVGLQRQWLEAYRGRGLSLERVLLDVHSGRIFGRWGFVVVDVAAVLFAMLAASGVWMWLRNRRQQNAKHFQHPARRVFARPGK